MIVHRPAAERGHVRTDWLDSRHTFSFGHYYDPGWMGFGVLRVINEDRVAGGGGFAPHRHANMEILSYVVSGGLAHRDSTGGGGVIGPGELQWMSAGHGVEHSEFNASDQQPVHFLQIWLQPDRVNAPPAYAQRAASDGGGAWTLMASPDGHDDSLAIRQDARVFEARLDEGEALGRPLQAGRRYWVQVVVGDLSVNGHALGAGDALGLVDEAGELALSATGTGQAVALVFDLPA